MSDDPKKLAKAIVNFNPLHDGDFDDDWAEDATTVSKAYLALRTRVEELERAAWWALGHSPKGLPEFPAREPGDPAYWWRRQFRKIANMPDKMPGRR
jgi:hypothetical protein